MGKAKAKAKVVWTNRHRAAFVRSWVKALRSGKYKQSRFNLASEDGYCCLGVACEMLHKRGLLQKRVGGGGDILYGSDACGQTLPKKAMKLIGLCTESGEYGTTRSLTSDNDSLRKTFDGIAEIIERKPDGLFVKA